MKKTQVSWQAYGVLHKSDIDPPI